MKKTKPGKKDEPRSIIHGKMTINETMKKYPKTAFVFLDYGLHCVGCPMANPETIEEAVRAHNLDLNQFIEDLNKAVE